MFKSKKRGYDCGYDKFILSVFVCDTDILHPKFMVMPFQRDSFNFTIEKSRFKCSKSLYINNNPLAMK